MAEVVCRRVDPSQTVSGSNIEAMGAATACFLRLVVVRTTSFHPMQTVETPAKVKRSGNTCSLDFFIAPFIQNSALASRSKTELCRIRRLQKVKK